MSCKIILAHLKIWRSKTQPFSGNLRPDLLTSLMNMSLVLHLPRKIHLCRSSSNAPRLPTLLKLLQHTLTFCSLLARCRIPCACHSKPHPNFQKQSETVSFLHCSLPQCASRHNGVHFFDISTSKSAPNLVCFPHFDFEVCFVPRQRAIFYLSSPQTAPHFSEPTFRLSWKNTMSRDFATVSRTCIFCLLTLSLLWSSFFFSLLWLFPPLLLHLCILSEVWLLNFLRLSILSTFSTLNIYLSICLVYLSICLSIYLSFFLSTYLCIYLSIHLSIYLVYLFLSNPNPSNPIQSYLWNHKLR